MLQVEIKLFGLSDSFGQIESTADNMVVVLAIPAAAAISPMVGTAVAVTSSAAASTGASAILFLTGVVTGVVTTVVGVVVVSVKKSKPPNQLAESIIIKNTNVNFKDLSGLENAKEVINEGKVAQVL